MGALVRRRGLGFGWVGGGFWVDVPLVRF